MTFFLKSQFYVKKIDNNGRSLFPVHWNNSVHKIKCLQKLFLHISYFITRIDSVIWERDTTVLVVICPTKLKFQEKKYFGHFLGKILDHSSCGRKIQFNQTLVRIVRCRIARTRLIPLYHIFVGIYLSPLNFLFIATMITFLFFMFLVALIIISIQYVIGSALLICFILHGMAVPAHF